MKMNNPVAWLSGLGIVTLTTIFILYNAPTYMAQSRKNAGYILQTRAETRVLAYNLQQYREEIGTLPPTDNKRVVDSLCGENPKHNAYCERSDFRLNERGEVIDPFGSPYIFSYLEGKVKVTSSAVNVSADENLFQNH
jgi:hypothetical protein